MKLLSDWRFEGTDAGWHTDRAGWSLAYWFDEEDSRWHWSIIDADRNAIAHGDAPDQDDARQNLKQAYEIARRKR